MSETTETTRAATVADLCMTARLANCLWNAYHCDENKKYDLMSLSPQELVDQWPPERLKRIRGLGKRTLVELGALLSNQGVEGMNRWQAVLKVCPTCGQYLRY